VWHRRGWERREFLEEAAATYYLLYVRVRAERGLIMLMKSS